MARRGGELREHILWSAKDVFLEQGFERTSMDLVANQAHTSKRSLYAHFHNKETLFLAVIDLVRGLFLGRLQTPAEYSDSPLEALTKFSGRYLEILLYEASIQMLRMSMAESERFPEQAAQYFDAIFEEVRRRMSAYIRTTFSVSARSAAEATETILGCLLYPRLYRSLFGAVPLAKTFNQNSLDSSFDLKPVRKIIAHTLQAFGDG